MSLSIDTDASQASLLSPVVKLKVEGLTVHFGQRTLFKEISFTLLDREILFVRGASGTGVSVLLRVPDAFMGSCFVEGQNFNEPHDTGKSRLFRALAQLDYHFEGDIRLQVRSSFGEHSLIVSEHLLENLSCIAPVLR
jgi:ABC-type phosphonate transport system ATPase subunit